MFIKELNVKLKSILLSLPVILALAACSKLNKDNYEQLEVGMDQKKVESILGSADNCSENLGTLTCIWGDEDGKHIKVRFVADAAIVFTNSGL